MDKLNECKELLQRTQQKVVSFGKRKQQKAGRGNADIKIVSQDAADSSSDNFNRIIESARRSSEANQDSKKMKEKRSKEEKSAPKSGSASGFTPGADSDMQSFSGHDYPLGA